MKGAAVAVTRDIMRLAVQPPRPTGVVKPDLSWNNANVQVLLLMRARSPPFYLPGTTIAIDHVQSTLKYS